MLHRFHRRGVKATAHIVAGLVVLFASAQPGHAVFLGIGTVLDNTPTHFLFEVDYPLISETDPDPGFDFITVDTLFWSMTIQFEQADFSDCLHDSGITPFCYDDLRAQGVHVTDPHPGDGAFGPLLSSLHFQAGTTYGDPFTQLNPFGFHLGNSPVHFDDMIFTTFHLNATTGRARVELFHTPEPSAILLLGSALVALVWRRRRGRAC